MRSVFTFAYTVLLTTSSLLSAQAADLPTKGHAPAKTAVKAPAKVAAKPQVKPQLKAAPRRTVAVAAPVALSSYKAPAAAQVITYSGVVLGPNELALPGACVFVAGDRNHVVVTNAQGEFALTLPATQEGELTVAYGGMAESRIPMAGSNHTALFVTLEKK